MEIIDNLEKTRNKALEYYELEDFFLHLTYEEGKWNIRQLLCHISDVETVLYDRIRRVIAEPKQVIWGFDDNLWAKNLDYNSFPLSISKQTFNAVREGVIYLADKFYQELGNKQFIHSETGIRTLRDEFDKVAWHCEHHSKQIELAINKAK
jgi:hypothetical protein